ncbi:MAG: T9SS type A sorting domain-containing protein, partial [Bacteroidota bacterium]|nr:T9SS type A sorting domain-containing protein [Bacteroidota bacterium]
DQKNNIWIATANGISKFTDKNVGIVSHNSISYKIYPNPASNAVFLEHSGIAKVQVMDIAGNNLFNIALLPGETKIDISSLNTGFYILSVTESGKTGIAKLSVL